MAKRKAKQQNGRNDSKGGTSGSGGSDSTPASKAVANRLKGGHRNFSSSQKPRDRPAYPYILEAATSTLALATEGGLTPSWFATYANVAQSSNLDSWQQFSEYNFSLTDESRRRAALRYAFERPFTPRSRGKVPFLLRNGQGSLVAETTGTDGILAVEEFHMQISEEFGRWVKFHNFSVDVNTIYNAQRHHSEYGLGQEYFKTTGQPYTPYERLHATLLARIEPLRNQLNLPAHLAAIADLTDLTRAAFALLAPSTMGLDSNTWSLPSGINIHADAFRKGYDSLDFGQLVDKDGNIRYLIQMPAEALVGDEVDKPVLTTVKLNASQLYTDVNGNDATQAQLDAVEAADIATYLSGTATSDDVYISGVNLRDLPGSLALFKARYNSVTGTVQYTPDHGISSSWTLDATTVPDPASFKTASTLTAQPVWAGPTKLWCSDALTMLKWLRAASEVLSPEYLATSYPRLLDVPLTGNLAATTDINKLVDCKNLDSTHKIRFNPIKHIVQNNGPYGKDELGIQFSDSWRERNWLSPSPMDGDYDFHVERLSELFSSLTFETGFGDVAAPLAETLALLNLKVLDAMFTITNTGSLEKDERIVIVPAGMAAAASGYVMEEGEHSADHALLLLQRLFGSFCLPTFSLLADLSYDDNPLTSAAVQLEVETGYLVHGGNHLNLPNFVRSGTVTLGQGDSAPTFSVGWATGDQTGLEFSIKPVDVGSGVSRFLIEQDSLSLRLHSDLGILLSVEHGWLDPRAATLIGKDSSGNVVKTRVFVRQSVLFNKHSKSTFEYDLRLGLEGTGAYAGTIMADDVRFKGSFVKKFALRPGKGIKAAVDEYDTYLSSKTLADGGQATVLADDTAYKIDGTTSAEVHVNVFKGNYTSGFDASGPFAAATGMTELTNIVWENTELRADTSKGLHVRLAPQHSGTNNSSVAPAASGTIAAWNTGTRLELIDGVPSPASVVDEPWRIGLGVLWHYFGSYAADATTPTSIEYKTTLWTYAKTPVDNSASEFGSEAGSVRSSRFIPQNENLFQDLRRYVFDAAVLDFSHMRFYPLELNAQHGLLPYHGEPQGFMRSVISEYTPEIARYHFQSQNPFLADVISRIRTEKVKYNPMAYQLLFSTLSEIEGSRITGMTVDDLRRAQDVIVRRSQSGV